MPAAPKDQKRGPGRPRKEQPKRPPKRPFKLAPRQLSLTRKVQTDLVKLVAEGRSLRQAALACGVPDSTARGWLHQGRGKIEAGEHEHELTEFVRQVDAARAHFESELIRQLEWELDQGIRATDRVAWTRRRLALSSPEDWGDSAAEPSAGSGLSAKDIQAALEALETKMKRLLGIPEEDASALVDELEGTADE